MAADGSNAGSEETSAVALSARADMALLIEAVREGGRIATRYAGGNLKMQSKADGSPVTDADIAVDEALAAFLTAARPAYGWCSEEGIFRAAAHGCSRAFVVDPIDGTRAFIRGDSTWTVVAAVIDGGRPIAGVVLRPATGQIYCAALGSGAFRDNTAMRVSACSGLDGARVSLPGPLFRDAGFRDAGVLKAGAVPSLALRLVKVADGELDGTITKHGPHHWDLAAADLIVHEAGGRLTNLSGALHDYSTEVTAHGPTVASPPAITELLRAMAEPHVTSAV